MNPKKGRYVKEELRDIVIYTNPETLLHKQDKLENDIDKSLDGCYMWEFSRPPKSLEYVMRIYFAVKGQVVGYFKTKSVDDFDCISWDSKTWTPIEPIPCKPFRGFRYVWWK